MKYTFPKSIRLRTRGDYQRINHHSKRWVGRWVLIDSVPNKISTTRLGITVTKKFGDAHERNRFKRIVREAYRLYRDQFKSGLDFNVRPRSQAKEAKTQDILQEFERFKNIII